MIASRHIEIFIMIFASVLAIYVGSQIVALPIPILMILLAVIFIFGWGLTAGSGWWVPLLACTQIGGIFYFGVKVTPTMVGVGLAVLGLIPLILVQNQKVLQRKRRPLPFIFYATALYIVLRLVVDIVPAEGGRSNLFRVLFDAFWPFFFGFLFHHYGSLNTAKAAVWVIFVILSIRCVVSLAGFIFSIPVYIPGIQYILSTGGSDGLIPMRQVALALLMVILILFHGTKSFLTRLALIPFMLSACALVVMGQGRFATFTMLLAPAVFFAWSRRWMPLFVAFVAGTGILIAVNLAPQVLDKLNPAVGRAFSGLVIGGAKTDIQALNKGSDEWHDSLKEEGYLRWTQSPLTVIFGYGVRPTPDYYSETTRKTNPQEVIERAANLGSFECGLWTIITLYGLVGITLYGLLFINLWKQTFPYFFRRPRGTFWEGMIFWACYSSILWFVVCDFQGGFPSVELVLMLIAADIIQDGKFEVERVEASAMSRSRPVRLMPLSYPPLRA